MTPPSGAAPLRQAGPTACGPAVLLVTAALASGHRPDVLWPASAQWSAGAPEPAETQGPAAAQGFAAAQRRVHRQANRLWPRVLGTTPFGMQAWLHRHAPDAGRYRIRWTPGGATGTVLESVSAGAREGGPVPLMIGSRIPRHWVLVSGVDDDGWRVYEPSSGRTHALAPQTLRTGTARAVLGWPRLHAALLPDGRPPSQGAP